MTHPRFELSGGPLSYSVKVNGHDLTKGLRSVKIQVEPEPELPRVMLELNVYDLERVDLPEVQLVIPGATRDALISLGWTPPAEDEPERADA